MRSLLVAALAALLVAPAARGHFVFVVPDGPNKAAVVLSEDLKPDSGVKVHTFAGTTLTVRTPGAKDIKLSPTVAADHLTVEVPGTGPRVVFGFSDQGVMERGAGFRLLYYPKAVFGPADEVLATVGGDTPTELVPLVAGDKLRLKVLANGKPAEGVEVSVLPPGGEWKKVTTDKAGLTAEFAGVGRYAAWGRVVEPTAGEHGGKTFAALRRYPTLVVDVAKPGRPPLPKAAASLGAVAADGYLYVYGGHAGKTHGYDTTTALGTFHRVKLDGGTAWEELPGGPKLQGMNLAAHGGKIYRVGGMQPRNAPGTPADTVSVADAARFDPKAGTWEPLPPLPAPRSSHDVVVTGDKLVVVGGWQMRGKGESSVWPDVAYVLDLSAATPAWAAVPQPFKRRALTAAAVGSKVYVLGGLGADGMDKGVAVLDLSTGTWSAGPPLPGESHVAFSPAAGAVNGRLVVNTSDGPVYRLTEAGDGWEKVGETARRRIVHRLIPHGPSAVLLVGGASAGENVGPIDEVPLTAHGEKVTTGSR